MGMAGELVPFVMIPRFTSYFGTSEFETVALDVSAYSAGTLTLWRGKLVGTSATFGLYTETSHDGYEWFGFPSTMPWDPGADASTQIAIAFNRRFFRVRLALGGTDPGVTCWCAGMLEYRVD